MRIPFLLLISLFIGGCAHWHHHAIHLPQDRIQPVREQLREFFLANGFEESEEKISEDIVGFWEKWWKGFLTPYSGAVTITELYSEGRYSILIRSAGREPEALEVSKNLRKWIKEKFPELEVKYEDQSFLDLTKNLDNQSVQTTSASRSV